MLKATNAKHIAAIAKWVRDGTTNHDTRPAVVWRIFRSENTRTVN